tara:strand:- start:63 stop:245 length:183 start_codon:yes stop_codon:yes gene_type:complete
MLLDIDWLIERFFQEYPEWRLIQASEAADDDDSSSDYEPESDIESEDYPEDEMEESDEEN